jgi:hypothetical protein
MSLTNTSKSFRKGIKILGVVMVVYYVAILFVIPTTKEFILNLLVDRNPPNPKYGKMDALRFAPAEIKKIGGQMPPIVLSTKDGRLPAGLPKKMTVYKFKGIQYSYLAGQGSQDDANKLGFSEAELISDLKGKEYIWRSLVSGGTLYINTETKAILATTQLSGKSNEYPRGTINPETIKVDAIEILRQLGRYDDMVYKPEYHKVAMGQFLGNTIVETKATADAQVARVDFFGKIDNYPILGPDAKKGLIWMILRTPTRGQTSPYNYPTIEASIWNLTSENDGSYPIITVQEAWKQVVAGKGVISSVRQRNFNPFDDLLAPEVERILINNIYLAYYQTPEFQKFLQPIYVFEGKYTTNGSEGGDVVVYYPALTAEYTRPATPVTQQSSSTPKSN